MKSTRNLIIAFIILLSFMSMCCQRDFQVGDDVNICIKNYKVYNQYKEYVYTHCREYRDGVFSRSFAIDSSGVRWDPTLACIKDWNSYPDGECIVCHSNLW